MLENILKINGVQKLEGNKQKSIKGGDNVGSICPVEGDFCLVNGGTWRGIWCLAGAETLVCQNNVWQSV